MPNTGPPPICFQQAASPVVSVATPREIDKGAINHPPRPERSIVRLVIRRIAYILSPSLPTGNGSKVTNFKPTIRVRGSKSATIEKGPTPPECLAEAFRAAPGSRLKCDHPRSRRLRPEGARGVDAAIPAANRHLIYREPGHPVVLGGGGAYYLIFVVLGGGGAYYLFW